MVSKYFPARFALLSTYVSSLFTSISSYDWDSTATLRKKYKELCKSPFFFAYNSRKEDSTTIIYKVHRLFRNDQLKNIRLNLLLRRLQSAGVFQALSPK